MNQLVNITINGHRYRLEVPANLTLLDLLRHRLGLMGTKKGCDTGDCGSCTVLVDGKALNACLCLAVEVDGCQIETIEGLQTEAGLHPLQEAFVDHGAVQCGFCTSGMIMASKALIDEVPHAGDEQIKEAIAGNLCRCTGYQKIIKAVASVARPQREPTMMAREFGSNIGDRIPRAEARSLVTGQAVFLDDFELPGTLHGRILRSPHPHALILNIDTRAAFRLPGVWAVITAADTPKIPFCHMPITPNKLPLRDEKVRFVGDEVAAVAASNPEVAEEALDLIRVEYEQLPAVFDVEEAMREGAPILHDDCPDNVATRFARKFGSPDEAMAQADHVFEDEFDLPRVASCSMEPHGCIARWEADGRLTIYDSTQSINNIQEDLSVSLGIPLNKIRVISLHVGGAFGNKSALLPLEPIAAILSRKSGRPVKIIYTRREDFMAARTRYAMHISLRTGVSKDGKLLARQAKIITENGAYNNKAPGITAVTCNRIGNLYRVPHSSTEALVVYTNNQDGGALRGWGGPQAHFAIESQMDMIAHKLGMDPLELRLNNANQAGDVTPWGWRITSCGLSRCLRQAAASFRWELTDQPTSRRSF